MDTKQTDIAKKNFKPAYYQSKDSVEAGLAETHEQATDTLTEGTVDGVIDDVNGKDEKIKRQGYK